MNKKLIKQMCIGMLAVIFLVGCSTQNSQESSETHSEDNVEVVESQAGNEEATEVSETSTQEDEEEINTVFSIVIDGEPLEDLTKEITVKKGSTVMDIMMSEYEIEDEGGFISVIEGNEQDVEAERYWMYYINDEMATVGASDYEIEDGDNISWRLEDSDF